MDWDQDALRAQFCHALSEMYKSEVPLYGDLVDLVWKADAEAVKASQELGGPDVIDPDDVLPSRNRVERHGAIRLGTAHELATIRRMFAVMGMSPVGYYDLTMAGFPMHATAFRPKDREALAKHPFRVFTTVLRMELLTERTRELAQKALEQRNIFTDRLIALIDLAEKQGHLNPEQSREFIAEGLETFRWHSKATVTLEEYQILKAEHPLIADIVSFPSCHINHLTPRTVDIDLVQKMMQDHDMPAKERIEGPPKRLCPILLRQTSFKALEETVYFRDARNAYIKGSHTARFGEVEQRGYALTRTGRQLYDQILDEVNREWGEKRSSSIQYEKLLEKHFKHFPDDLDQLQSRGLAYFCYRLTPGAKESLASAKGLDKSMDLTRLLERKILAYEPITYEDFLPLSAGGIFNSNLGNTSQSKQLIMEADADLDGFQRMLGTSVTNEFHLYEKMQKDSLETCRERLGLDAIFMASTESYDDPNISYRIWVGTIVTVVPATFAVVFRFIGRHISRAGFWWDDYTIAIALVFNWAMSILRWIQVLEYGLGRHAYFLSEDDVEKYQKSFLAVQLLYFTNAVFTKASLLLLYQRIFGVVTRFLWALRITGFLVTAYWIACSIVAVAGCSPVSYFWNKDQPGSCIDETNFFRWNGIANIFLDFLVLCVPFPMLWYIKTSLRQKFLLSGIFLLGGFVCITSIVRVIAFDLQNTHDPTYTTVDTAAWSSIEQSVGILCACLPTMRPFFRRLYGTSAVVGGGNAGLTVASRLTEGNSNLTVAVVEAGGFYEVDNGNLSVVPGYTTYFSGSDPNDYQPLIDWGITTEPQKGLEDRRIHYARGKTLGGSSARNYMVYHRPTIESMQRWADEVDDQSYTFDNMLPYFKKSVHYTPPNQTLYANTSNTQTADAFAPDGGPLEVSFSNAVLAFGTWARKAYIALGMGQIDGLNSGKLLGSAFGTSTIDPTNAHRSSSESSFLRQALNTGAGPVIYKNSLAQRILFNSDKAATGVEVSTAGTFGTPPITFTLSARKEVIISAGAFQSPQLLMVSGIGACNELRQFKIPCLQNLRGVGKNMEDHALFGASRRVNFPTASATANNATLAALMVEEFINEAAGSLTVFGPGYFGWEKMPEPYRSRLSKQSIKALSSFPDDWPEIEWLTIGAFNGYGMNKQTADPKDGYNYGTISSALVAPLSRGTVSLAGPDMNTLPLVDPQWLVDPTDKELAIEAFKRGRQIWDKMAEMGAADSEEYFPGTNVTTDEQIHEFIQKSMTTVYHASCTCKMGRRQDPMAVVDSSARVYGVSKLRVVDSSSFPFLPPGHPQSVVYALAEKIADEILKE
ncbi:hypothetical protein BDV59DRAFT_190567 [Aspergillus ambiguus]|uniref:uncharacterized protein n=1 Tax=Aspergillus ambiguus TaxID=176160 RepID=UPI003CCDD1F0